MRPELPSRLLIGDTNARGKILNYSRTGTRVVSKISNYVGIFMLNFYLASPVMAELDRAKEAQEIVEAMVGTTASLWLATTDIYQPGASDGNKTVALSHMVFSKLREQNLARVTVGKHDYLNVDLSSVASEIDNTFPTLTVKGNFGRQNTYVFFKLGTYDDIAVIDVAKTTDSTKCEWEVTYRGWITDPTIVANAITASIGIDGLKDGFTFRYCFKVGRKGLENAVETFVYD